MFSASKTQFFLLSTRHSLPDNYPGFSMTPKCPLFYSEYLSFTYNLNLELHILSLATTGLLRRLLFHLPKLQTLYKDLISAGRGSTHSVLIDRVESKYFHLINSSPMTDCFQPLPRRRNVASFTMFCCYVHANCSIHLATARSSSSYSFAAQGFILLFTPYSVQLSNAGVNQYC